MMLTLYLTSLSVDVFRQFGNPSWSWTRVVDYMKKAQNYKGPGEAAKKLGATWQDDGHGVHGPVDVSFSDHSYTGLPQETFIEALNKTMGVDKIIDAGTGDGNGLAYCPHYIKHGSSNTRESSATAYYDPIEFERPNLHVLTGWRGVRVNWESKKTTESSVPPFWSSWQQQRHQGILSRDGKDAIRAASVTVQDRLNGDTFDMALTKEARSEVILSAGALITPLVLELSGVGDSEVMSRIGVTPRVLLPGVGRNLVEKATSIVVASGRNTSLTHVTGGPLPAVAMLSIDKVAENSTEIRQHIEANMEAWAKEAVESGGAANIEGVMKQFEVTKTGIFEDRWPVTEWEYFSKNEVAIKAISLLPWSRGFIHSKTKNSIWNAQLEDIDLHPQFWSRQIDLDVQVQSLRKARRMLASPEMKVVAGPEMFPGNEVANTQEDGDYAQWQKYILNTYGNIGHNMGTAAMMSRDLGGVVNQDFQVHGTSNLRVVDASIFPMQISAHPAATLFGIAEMAADVIRL
jgi:choline dehydrogenase